MSIENSVCDAIELIVDKKVSEAQFDRTVQAVVKKCVDETIGKYSVKYQDSTFYAYSTTADVTYNIGSSVYVLIPGNDMSRDKTILGTVDKLGINYVSQAEGDEAFDIIGTNVIDSSSKEPYRLSSFRRHNYPSNAATKTQYRNIIYDAMYNNTGIVNVTAANEYIKESSSLVCGASFKTSLPAIQQYQGNYGIIFTLAFHDNATGTEVLRDYQVDVDNMTGNPYKLELGKRQYRIFEVDGANFKRIDKIILFTEDFPNHKNDSEIANGNLFDIEVSEIECSGAVAMSESEVNGCGISFYTPDGAFFPAVPAPAATAKLRITAKVKVKGKSVNTSIQKIPFYWFQEDMTITAKSERYNQHGGRGWRCLNDFNVIAEATSEAARQVEWIDLGDTYYFPIANATARETELKCAIVYDGNTYYKTIVIKNLYNTPTITVTSDKGTNFYLDNGRPTLTCAVDGNNINYNSLVYSWAVKDAYGNVTMLPVDSVDNNTKVNDYNNAVSSLNALKSAVVNGSAYANASANAINQAQAHLDTFEYVQRVSGNRIYKVDVSTITNVATYKCSVYAGATYLGTGSIALTNSYEAEGIYTLVINNGTQTFKYNEYGVSPASKSLDNPIMIPTLSFNVFDNKGEQLSEDILRQCDISWKIPIKNTMLTFDTSYSGTPDATQEHKTVKSYLELAYGISNQFSYTSQDNLIELTVKYKSLVLTARTNLNFVKEGESGTNGSDYTCKIVPNSTCSDLPMYPTLTAVSGVSGGYMNFKSAPSSANFIRVNGSVAPFKVILYKSGEQIYSGTSNGTTADDGGVVTVEWSILTNTYKSGVADSSNLTINKNNGILNYTGNVSNPANIIKCTVYYNNAKLGKRYCITDTLSLITSVVNNSNYHIYLKENSGFRSVQYTSDGKLPKYNNTKPFEIIVTKMINGYEETVSMLSQSSENISNFSWSVFGNKYNFSSSSMTTSNDLTLLSSSVYRNGLAANQYDAKPTQDYDGVCVNNAVYCTCSAGSIHIPVHFLLNKYGLSQLNGWDGNTVQIDNEGGFILAPQVGAGVKNTDNSFTGVLMGEVQEPNRTDTDIGLLGYNAGTRTFKLDAKNGSAILGAGQGQIVMDPSQSRALIYSHNFYKGYNSQGLPSSYNSGNENSQGLMIDLTTPEIRFGSGNFKVDSSGYITAKGGGTIAGWNIDNDSLFTSTKTDSANTRISTVDFTRTINGTSRSSLRLALGQKFAVSSNGTMYAGDAILGTGSNKITLGQSDSSNSAIYSGSKSSYASTSNGFYLATDGFSLGSNFFVNTSGQMTAKSGYIGNGSNGWTIKSNYLVNGSKTSYNDSNAGVYIGTSGIGLGKGKFYVSSTGSLHAESGTVGGWTLSATSLTLTTSGNVKATLGTAGISVGSTFSVNSSGHLTCSSASVSGTITTSNGKIGGWTINGSGITNGTAYFYSSGACGGSNWSITAAGKASFSNIYASGGEVKGGIVSAGIQGGNINSGSVGSTQLGSGSVTTVKIADAAITSAKIHNAAITNAKIANASITDAKISGKISANHIDASSLTINGGQISVIDSSQTGHNGQTFSMHFLRNLHDQMIIYFCKGICVGYSQN